MVLYGSVLLLLLGGIQGLLLGLLLLQRKAWFRAYLFLVLYLAVMLGQIGFLASVGALARTWFGPAYPQEDGAVRSA